MLNRGVGRYTLQQLRAVLRLDRTNTYLLLVPSGARDQAPGDLGDTANLQIEQVPAHLSLRGHRLRREQWLEWSARFDGWLDTLAPDLVHFTMYALLGEGLPRILACPVVYTHYDLIPRLYPEHYFTERYWQEEYERRLRIVRGGTRLIAISEFSRQEVIEHLGIEPERVDVARPFAEPSISVLPPAEIERSLAGLRARADFGEGFVFSVSYFFHSKNLTGLLRGYAELPRALRARHPLVLAFDLWEDERAIVAGMAREAGLGEGEVAFTGFVTDDELRALYNAALFYVHASRYEGFGIPLLEAMRCGKAVATSRAASLPEVAGEVALYFDPEDPADIGRALRRLIEDEELRHRLEARAPERVERFTAKDLGTATLRAYERAAETAAPRSGRCRPERPRVALWTPLPPLRSGVADYSVELLPALESWADVEVFVDGECLPEADLLERWVVRHHSEFQRRQERHGFDLIFYQFGSSLYHLFEAAPVERWPGVLTLHDLTWGHVLHTVAHRHHRREDFRWRLRAEEGDDALAEYDALGEPGSPAFAEGVEAMLNRRWLLGRLVDGSLGEIVHMPLAAELLRQRYPTARPWFFPMGVADPLLDDSPARRAAARRRYGLGEGTFVFGSFGIGATVKRLESAVRAVARLVDQGVDACYAIVGEFDDLAYRAAVLGLATELGVAERVRLLDHVSGEDFMALLGAVDAVVSLRFPFRQQMSATLARAVAAGKPVLATRNAAWEFLPADLCRKVSPGESEVEELAAALLQLARHPEMRQVMGSAARAWYLGNGTLEAMGLNYRRVFEAATGGAARSVK